MASFPPPASVIARAPLTVREFAAEICAHVALASDKSLQEAAPSIVTVYPAPIVTFSVKSGTALLSQLLPSDQFTASPPPSQDLCEKEKKGSIRKCKKIIPFLDLNFL
jgi:hypothetical protein